MPAIQMDNRIPCHQCSIRVLPKTATRYGGVCRRCALRPKQSGLAALVLLAFSAGTFLVPYMVESQIAMAIRNGTVARVPFMIALPFKAFGLTGGRIVFWVIGGITLLAALHSAKKWNRLRTELKNARSNSNGQLKGDTG